MKKTFGSSHSPIQLFCLKWHFELPRNLLNRIAEVISILQNKGSPINKTREQIYEHHSATLDCLRANLQAIVVETSNSLGSDAFCQKSNANFKIAGYRGWFWQPCAM